jgi:hypothetical protein
MNAEHERALLTRAHTLTDTDDLAEEVTAILGGARAARADPAALPGLAGAALALGADSLAIYRAQAPRFADDTEFAAAIEETDTALTTHADQAARLRNQAHVALTAACHDLAAAHRDLAAARAMPASDPCEGCHPARHTAITAANHHITQARQRAACAQEATQILDALTHRLSRALACLRRVTGDLADTYETVYDLRHRGHLMPKDGDWLTGHGTPCPSGAPRSQRTART